MPSETLDADALPSGLRCSLWIIPPSDEKDYFPRSYCRGVRVDGSAKPFRLVQSSLRAFGLTDHKGVVRRGSLISSPMKEPASHPPKAKKIVE
jgi:hypothetical protein